MDPELQLRINASAAGYLSRNLSIIPIGSGKKPAIRWAEYIDKILPKWDFPRCNIALLTGYFNKLVVVDCDSEESYIGWLNTKPKTPLRVRTKRGMQFYYQHPGRYVKSGAHLKDVSGFEYDVKGDRSYVLAPPSLRGGYQYQVCVCTGNIRGRFLPFEQLPVFDLVWRPDDISDATVREARGGIKDAVKYIDMIKPVSRKNGGEGRDKDVYRAACKLVESGMPEAEVSLVMGDWNRTNVTPPLPRAELLHKVSMACKQR